MPYLQTQASLGCCLLLFPSQPHPIPLRVGLGFRMVLTMRSRGWSHLSQDRGTKADGSRAPQESGGGVESKGLDVALTNFSHQELKGGRTGLGQVADPSSVSGEVHRSRQAC